MSEGTNGPAADASAEILLPEPSQQPFSSGLSLFGYVRRSSEALRT